MRNSSSFINILKTYGVISILLGYTFKPFQGICYAYHIPLLVFICAFLYSEEMYITNPFGYVGELFRKYWTKYVFYMILFVAFRNLFLHFGLYWQVDYYTFEESVRQMFSALVFSCYEPFGGVMWFVLPGIIACAMMGIVVTFSDKISKLCKKWQKQIKYILIIALTLLVAIMSSTSSIYALSMHTSLLLLPVCIMAYFVAKMPEDSIKKHLNLFVAMFFAGLIYVLVKYTGYRVDISMNVVPLKPWYYFLVFLGIYGCMTLAKYTEKIPFVRNVMALAGKHAFSVVALCLVAFKLCDRVFALITGEKNTAIFGVFVCAYPEKLWWLYLIMGLVLPVTFGVLMEKIKISIRKKIEKSDVI